MGTVARLTSAGMDLARRIGVPDDETMSRCQLLPVSSTQRRPRLVDLKSADVGKGWCFCCPTPREIEAMAVEVADTLGAGTPATR
jgi:hypothetical protein